MQNKSIMLSHENYIARLKNEIVNFSQAELERYDRMTSERIDFKDYNAICKAEIKRREEWQETQTNLRSQKKH